MKNVAMVVGCDINPLNLNVTDEESIKLIANAGFDKVFLSFKNGNWGEVQDKRFNECVNAGLEVIFAHLGYRGDQKIVDIWEKDDAGDVLVNCYKKDFEKLAKCKIPIAVMHLTKSNVESPMSKIGLARWRELVMYAEKTGITIALENTVWKGFIEFLFDNIQSDNLKICYDSGHDHLHFKGTFNFPKFENKIICTHIHDNDCTNDKHWLPFDGTINWNEITEKLKKSNYKGVITSEAIYGKEYQTISPEKFYKEAFNRLNSINAQINKT